MKQKTTIDGLKMGGVVKNTTSNPVEKPAKKTVEKSIKVPVKVRQIPATNSLGEKEIQKRDAEIERAHEDFLQPTKALELDSTKENKSKEFSKSTKKKKKGGKVGKIILWIVFILLAIVVGGIIWLTIWGNDLIVKLTGGNGNIWSAIGVLTDETYEPLKTDSNGRTNVLVFGTSGYDMEGTVENGKHYAGSQLTDSIMVVSLDQETGDVALVNVPRDLKAVKTCTATGKINEVYYCNSLRKTDADGAHALADAINVVLGLDVQYYVHVNWASVRTIVDALDGITVTLDEDIKNYDNNGLDIKAGVPTYITGQRALALARARHGAAGGDFSRGSSQQKILIGIKDRIQERGLGIVDILKIVNDLGDNLRTDCSMSDIKTGFHLLETLDINNMRQIPLYDLKKGVRYVTTGTINGISYVLPQAGEGNYTAIRKYIADMVSSDPIKREGARIAILNGSGVNGIAGKEEEKLTKKGYRITKVANAPEGNYPDPYYIYAVNREGFDATLKMLEEEYWVDIHDKDELPAGISMTDYDIVIIMGIPEKTE